MGCCMGTPQTQKSTKSVAEQPPQRSSHRESSSQRRESESRSQRHAARHSQGRQQSQNNTGLRITYLQVPNVEIIKADKVIGKGVQKTLAYDTPLTEEGLQKQRQEFWETRTSGAQHIWQLLRNACDEDHMTAIAMIEAAQLQLPQDSLTTAIDMAGVYYRVPIYCISNPDNYEVDNVMDAMRSKKAPKETMYTIEVRNVAVGNEKVKLSNLSTIESLKKSYLGQLPAEKVQQHGLELSKIRFFSMGKELKDDFFIYSYSLQDNMVVQAMFRK